MERLVRTANENSVENGESAARTQADNEERLRTDIREPRERDNVHLKDNGE